MLMYTCVQKAGIVQADVEDSKSMFIFWEGMKKELIRIAPDSYNDPAVMLTSSALKINVHGYFSLYITHISLIASSFPYSKFF